MFGARVQSADIQVGMHLEVTSKSTIVHNLQFALNPERVTLRKSSSAALVVHQISCPMSVKIIHWITQIKKKLLNLLTRGTANRKVII